MNCDNVHLCFYAGQTVKEVINPTLTMFFVKFSFFWPKILYLSEEEKTC